MECIALKCEVLLQMESSEIKKERYEKQLEECHKEEREYYITLVMLQLGRIQAYKKVLEIINFKDHLETLK